MTEKVKVTREQAEAIERIKTEQIKRFEEVKKNKTTYLLTDWEKPLFELDSKHLQDALYIGYEVEPEFNKGDFVVWHGLVVNIQHPQTNDHKDDGSCYFTLVRSDGSTYGNITRDEIRHATPSEIAEEKERRWWKKLGRNVIQYEIGDVVLYKGLNLDSRGLCEITRVFSEDGVSISNDLADSEIDV